MPIRHAVNAEYASGMGSSFRTAVAHLGDSAAAMFALADQPFVTTNEYRTVLNTYRQQATAIVSVRYGDVMAPPHLFEREFFPELARLQHGARPVLRRHHDRTLILQFSSRSVDGYRHARGLRLRQKPSRVGAMKTAEPSR